MPDSLCMTVNFFETYCKVLKDKLFSWQICMDQSSFLELILTGSNTGGTNYCIDLIVGKIPGLSTV